MHCISAQPCCKWGRIVIDPRHPSLGLLYFIPSKKINIGGLQSRPYQPCQNRCRPNWAAFLSQAMRLINVDTFELEFVDHRSTRYAILSHTWDTKEVTFDDMQRGLPHVEALPCFEKIRGACRQAASDGFKFVWVDTCCIDKSSSAELSEAINSMFRWYSDAGICYGYLSDVTGWGGDPEAASQFRNSRWFTRGWTLQELLAPKTLVFYSRDWIEMGSKARYAMPISKITGIDSEAVAAFDMTGHSVAERMSWASGRVTTRQEDIAYCLLGLFGVNMPLLYGEGERAFVRLEEEIIKSSDDHSIFTWTSSSEAPHTTGGLLATSPLQFKHSGTITPYKEETYISRPYLMTNKGLSIKTDLLRGSAPQEYFAVLDCLTTTGSVLAICLRELVPSKGGLKSRFSSLASAAAGDQFTRVRCDELYALQSRKYDGTSELFVRQTTNLIPPVVSTRGTKAFILEDRTPSYRLSRVLRYPPDEFYPRSREVEQVPIYRHDGGVLVDIPESVNDWVATAIFKSTASGAEVWVMLGWMDEFGVSVHVCQSYDKTSLGDIIDINLRPLSSSVMKRDISHRYLTPEGEAKTKLIPAAVGIDTQHEQGIGALYKVLYKVIVSDDWN